MTTTVELLHCPSGDWQVLLVNGEQFASGHSISNYDWIRLINRYCYDVDVTEREILDEDMMEGNYGTD